MRVLLAEDDRSIAQQLFRGLTRAGCKVMCVRSGDAALHSAQTDLVLLDLGLPDIDGIEVCRRLRRRDDRPIIVITARDAERDRVLALDTGADDFLSKPFGFDELLARMRAVLRRVDRSDPDILRHGPLTCDVGARRVEFDGRVLALTGKEFDILACLAAEPGRVVSREEIFDCVWDRHWYGPTKVLDVHLVSLRRKLGDGGLIETVHGHGFRLRAT